MKFEKFVKSLATKGVIYEHGALKERWLASPSVYMSIPIGVRSVTAAAINEMPLSVGIVISGVGHTVEATLTKAISPYPNSGIKDCVRVYTSIDGSVSIPISNENYSLIEKSDYVEILYDYDTETETYTAQALLIKHYPLFPDDDLELAGIIYPTDTIEEAEVYG